MFKELQNGWIPPTIVTEEDYVNAKKNQDNELHVAGFVGFACSFAGKYWGGYARDSKGGGEGNYALRGHNSILKKMEGLKNAQFTCSDFKDLDYEGAIIYCMPEGSLIYQDGSYKPIEQVIENKTDLGNGNLCLEKHIRYTENEEIINLNIMGISRHYDMKLSKNHIVFTYNQDTKVICEKRAEDLSTNDLLIIEYEKNINNFIPQYSLYSNKSRKNITVDYSKKNELSELMGLFMAEGHLQNGIYFSFNINEKSLHEQTYKLIKSVFNLDAKINDASPHKSVTQVVCSSVELEQYFLEFYNGKNANDKKLNDFVMNWDNEMQLYLLRGWLKGDGGLQEVIKMDIPKTNKKRSGKRNKFKLTGTSSSFELATQMYNISLRCGLHPCFKKRITKRKIPLKNGNIETTSYDIYFTMKKDIEKIYNIEIKGRNCGRRFHTDNFLVTKINSISSELYTGNMYDLTTQKSEFWGFGNVKIHNCDPPYKGTTPYYKKILGEFPYDDFIEWVKSQSKKNTVLVSEYKHNVPIDAYILLEIPSKTSIRDKSGNVIETVEVLYTYNKEINICTKEVVNL